MTVDAAKLRALAQAATPGPWRLQDGEVLAADDIDCPRGYSPLNRIHTDTDGPDPAFIAAANPLTVLALLDAIVALRTALAIAESDARIGARHLAALVAMRSARDEACAGWEELWRSENNDPPPACIAELRKVGAR